MAKEKVVLDKDTLLHLYVNEKMGCKHISRILGCSERTVRIKLEKYGIKTRSYEEAGYIRRGRSCPHEIRRKISESSLKGELHPNWKGGRREINKKIRESVEYSIWRDSVFSRDDWTCVFCGKRGGVEADHIKRFSEYPELRFDVDNGRTLCVKCHRQLTKEQNREDAKKRAKACISV